LLRLVDIAPLSTRRCLSKLKLPKSTYYRWLHRQTLQDDSPTPKRVWNRLTADEEAVVMAYALLDTALSPRELAFTITDSGSFSVSESTVYRILKRAGLTRQYPQSVKAAKEYHRKTTRVNELWQTDLTELVLPDWGKHVLGGVVDDFSRFPLVFRRLRSAKGDAVQELIAEAVAFTGMETVPRCERVHLLSDNGACYVWDGLKVYLKSLGIKHIFSMRNHPQTNGKIERLNRTVKDQLTLIVHASPEAFDRALEAFLQWYRYEHYHEGIGNLHPADVYYGRADAILMQRKALQKATKKARKQANLKPKSNPKNPRKKRHLHQKSLQ
jgi:putative transposase